MSPRRLPWPLFALPLGFLVFAVLPVRASAAGPGGCGALNARPCTVFERVPSCDSGLVELAGKCLKKGDCGAEGKRACLVVERVPSCNANLVERQGQCIRLACGRLSERPCLVTERIPSCDAGLVEYGGKCLQRMACGAEGQRPCTVGERTPSCNANLVEKNAQCIHPDCGRMGQRACTVGERIPSCDSTLKEVPGCTGECKGSIGMCADMSIPLTDPSPGWTAVPGPVDPMAGWADVHVHMFANLGFGGAFVTGAAYDKVNGVRAALGPDWGTDLDVVESSGAQRPIICPALIPNCGKHLLHGDHVGLIDDLIGHGGGDKTFSAFGAPTFGAWPTWQSLTHQQVYFKWLERAWRGGMRLMTMLAVSNEAACHYSRRIRGTDCKNSMPAIDAQIAAAYDFEKWLDSTSGGTGQGWFRIVKTPDKAEEVIRAGKLAVVLGIEVDTLFGCKQKSSCTEVSVANEVDRYYEKGVRHIYPIHDFDGGFGGTAIFIADLNTGNHLIEGAHFDVGPCAAGVADYAIVGGSPACNKKGLTDLGKRFVNKLMDKGMLIDVDHMSVRSIEDTFALADQHGSYPLMVGHGLFADIHAADKRRHERMRTAAQLDKLRQLGGQVSVMTQNERKTHPRCLNSSLTFKDDYEYAVSKMGGPNAAAIPIGTDFNGVARHVGPRFGDDACERNATQKAAEASRARLAYPFTIPGFGKFDKQVTGQRTFDFNVDGLAHIGLLPDLIADLSREGTNMGPLFRSAAGYVASWRKAEAASIGVSKSELRPGSIPTRPVAPIGTPRGLTK